MAYLAGHAMASGIEKQSFPQSAVEYLGQDVTHMWLSTAFGHPVRNLLDDPPELLTDVGWKGLLEQIKQLLTVLKQLGDNSSPNDIDGWWRWRDAVGPKDGARRLPAPAETRLPNNVTLFDRPCRGRLVQERRGQRHSEGILSGRVMDQNNRPVGGSDHRDRCGPLRARRQDRRLTGAWLPLTSFSPESANR